MLIVENSNVARSKGESQSAPRIRDRHQSSVSIILVFSCYVYEIVPYSCMLLHKNFSYSLSFYVMEVSF